MSERFMTLWLAIVEILTESVWVPGVTMDSFQDLMRRDVRMDLNYIFYDKFKPLSVQIW